MLQYARPPICCPACDFTLDGHCWGVTKGQVNSQKRNLGRFVNAALDKPVPPLERGMRGTVELNS